MQRVIRRAIRVSHKTTITNTIQQMSTTTSTNEELSSLLSSISLEDAIDVEKEYKAAGILPYSFHPETNKMQFLLGKEFRPSSLKIMKRRMEPTWSEFGGKRDRTDVDSIATACREFCEETFGAYQKDHVQMDSELTIDQILEGKVNSGEDPLQSSILYMEGIIRAMSESEQKKHSLYFRHGKYRLFIVQLPYFSEDIFQAIMNDPRHSQVSHAEKSEMKWFDASLVLDAAHSTRSPWMVLHSITPNEILFPFFVALLQSAQKLLDEIVTQNSTGL